MLLLRKQRRRRSFLVAAVAWFCYHHEINILSLRRKIDTRVICVCRRGQQMFAYCSLFSADQ